ncbi:MAG: hypothetical protein LBR15_00825, partial [Methanobrevibacter sp.]|nr:hypothetical protein [Candidatus Methanovirga australis]
GNIYKCKNKEDCPTPDDATESTGNWLCNGQPDTTGMDCRCADSSLTDDGKEDCIATSKWYCRATPTPFPLPYYLKTEIDTKIGDIGAEPDVKTYIDNAISDLHISSITGDITNINGILTGLEGDTVKHYVETELGKITPENNGGEGDGDGEDITTTNTETDTETTETETNTETNTETTDTETSTEEETTQSSYIRTPKWTPKPSFTPKSTRTPKPTRPIPQNIIDYIKSIIGSIPESKTVKEYIDEVDDTWDNYDKLMVRYIIDENITALFSRTDKLKPNGMQWEDNFVVEEYASATTNTVEQTAKNSSYVSYVAIILSVFSIAAVVVLFLKSMGKSGRVPNNDIEDVYV